MILLKRESRKPLRKEDEKDLKHSVDEYAKWLKDKGAI